MVHHEFLSKPDLLLASTALQFSCSDVQPVRFRVLADGSSPEAYGHPTLWKYEVKTVKRKEPR